MKQKEDRYWMELALKEAKKAFEAGEVPIGAIIVRENQVIARASNQVELLKDATAHAEMIALTIAQEYVGDWRLTDCTLYVTKEPCLMCAGALVHCRIKKVVFGGKDSHTGGCGGWLNLLQSNPPLNHSAETQGGILEEECIQLLQSFFRKAREGRETNP